MGKFTSRRDPVTRLTARQDEIMRLMCEGLGYKEIADRLGISLPTVKNQAAGIREAMGTRTTEQAVALWVMAKVERRE